MPRKVEIVCQSDDGAIKFGVEKMTSEEYSALKVEDDCEGCVNGDCDIHTHGSCVSCGTASYVDEDDVDEDADVADGYCEDCFKTIDVCECHDTDIYQ